MNPEELRSAIALGREQRQTEFKGPGDRADKSFVVKVVRAILGMANTPDGGVVVIGVEDTGTGLNPVGLTPQQLQTWTHDDLHSTCSTYADPFVVFDLSKVELDGQTFIVVEVSEFEELPVLCKKDFPGALRNGALYVRRKGRVETIEVPSHIEMREVIERAGISVATRMLRNTAALGITVPGVPKSQDSYDREAKDLLG